MADADPGEAEPPETDSHPYASSSVLDTVEDVLVGVARRQLTDSVLECQRADDFISEEGEPFGQRRQLTDSAVHSSELMCHPLPEAQTLETSLRELQAQHEGLHGRQQAGQGRGDAAITLLLEPVPEACSQQSLMQELDIVGFAGLYDLAYVPTGLQGCGEGGFALVHFASADVAEGFRRAFQGRHLQHLGAQGPLRVLNADSRLFDPGGGRMHISKLEGLWSDQGSPLYSATRTVAALAAAVAQTASGEARGPEDVLHRAGAEANNSEQDN